MKKQTAHHNDLHSLAEDAQALLAATTDVAGEKVAEARKRLTSALEKGKETWNEVQEKAVEGAKATDQVIRDHPYQAIGVAFGVGAILGYILSRRN
ncbi:MAG: DUF883 domain-containing protein [Gloeobacteraceae cyanobacterium ES-bin-144]|nr:DUF883 domain-containing protein [Verrucomicrobiales bacterium]